MESTGRHHSRIHPEKRGVRVFGVAESFTKNSDYSTLCGVVLRRDMIVDGVVLGKALIGGDDATQQIILMFKELDRNDINCIMINGLIISLYNVIDGEKILETTGLPVIGVTYRESEGIEDSFFGLFPKPDAERRVEAYRKLGRREHITLKTGMTVYIRSWGINPAKTLHILNSFVIQGKIPEPLRIARLISRAARTFPYEDR
ncbi:MAG TPA: DUF99 family protein [Nitrososphaeraceae archaeon]|jgi:endonuclease V-like protein UPF0215 family|nr:DUF99 family protein [Nitrososphaeraceae archaeon]